MQIEYVSNVFRYWPANESDNIWSCDELSTPHHRESVFLLRSFFFFCDVFRCGPPMTAAPASWSCRFTTSFCLFVCVSVVTLFWPDLCSGTDFCLCWW
jgi:hypothetical protein